MTFTRNVATAKHRMPNRNMAIDAPREKTATDKGEVKSAEQYSQLPNSPAGKIHSSRSVYSPRTSTTAFTRPAKLKGKRIFPVASSLRKKLSKRQAIPDLKVTKSEDDSSSAGWLSDDSNADIASEQFQKRAAGSDPGSFPPPPQRELRSRSTSPSQSLLFRYKNRSSGQQTMAASTEQGTKAGTKQAIGSVTNGAEKPRSRRSSNSPDSLNETSTQANDVSKQTKRVNGVAFDMMDKKAWSSAVSHNPTSDNESHVQERRQTRSQARRQERSETHSKLLQPPASDHVQGLTIRKVRDTERTPSPHTNKDDNEDNITVASPAPLKPSPRNDDSRNKAQPSPTPTPTPTPSPTPDLKDANTARSRLPVAHRSDLARPKLSSYRRSQQSKTESTNSIEPTPVTPPMPNPQTPAGYIWTSSLSSTSRPGEPWGWAKRWTCCQCASLDPFDRDEPAQTMVEQKICARLGCGHERCQTGCRI